MNLSGILVVSAPERLAEVKAALEAVPGVDVHHVDPATGRIVVVQEAPTVEDEVAGLQRLKALPGVVLAEMVYHYFEDDPALAAAARIPSPDP